MCETGSAAALHSISTHAPAGGATRSSSSTAGASRQFLLTPLREGRPGRISAVTVLDNFYSRPCGRGDRRRLAACVDRLISTHAPAGGATQSTENDTEQKYISTHAPAGGATAGGEPGAGERHAITTHAPAGGATRKGLDMDAQKLVFLLTPLREGRRSGSRPAQSPRYFYSRPCGRGDQAVRRCRATTANFYSRPCGRGDKAQLALIAGLVKISTHAPAGGATIIPKR